MEKDHHNGPQKQEKHIEQSEQLNGLIYYQKQTVDQYKRFDLRFQSIVESPINASPFTQLKLAASFQWDKTWLTWKAKPSNVVKKQQQIHILSQKNTIKATWLGHASVILSIDTDVHILIDPVFQDRIIPYVGQKRIIKSPLTIQQLPPIDFVLISHDHYDHCNSPSLSKIYKKFGNQTTYLIGKQNQQSVLPKNSNAHQMSWTDTLTFNVNQKQIKVTFVPACHWSKRTLTDQNKRLWGGFVIQTLGNKIYFAGDTGYCPLFKELYQVFGGFDLSLLPIGAYEPNEFLKAQHVNPAEAVKIHNEVKSKVSIGIHWGTFPMSHQTPEQVMQDLENARIDIQSGVFITVNIGGSFSIHGKK